MVDVKQLLYEICEDPRVFEPDIDLVKEGLLDSYGIIELFTRLEDQGIELQPTRINRNLLHSVSGIEDLIEEAGKTA